MNISATNLNVYNIKELNLKKCTKCGLNKDKNEFHKNKTSKDGLYDWCKSCVKTYRKEYNKHNKEHRKEYYEENLARIKEYDKNRYENNREKYLLRHYKNQDKKKNLICDLTIEWLKENITSKPCIYCGETEHIGCDRIEDKGHTKDNVVPCCFVCNTARMDNFSFEEMLILGKTIKKIKQARKLKNDKKGKK